MFDRYGTPMQISRIVTILAAIMCAALPWKSLRANEAHGFSLAPEVTPRSSARPWLPKALQPSSVYAVDDGTAENVLGFTDGEQSYEGIFFNQFSVIPGQTTITAVEIAWGWSGYPQTLDGTPVTIGIWSDPNNDGLPDDGILLGSVAGTVANAGTNTFVTYAFSPPLELPPAASSFFVGNMTPALPQALFFQAFDQNSVSRRQSWLAGMSEFSPVDINNLGNNDVLFLLEDSLSGNLMIRADGVGPVGLLLQSAASVKGGFAITLPLVGLSGVEDRSGEADGTFTITMRFNHPIAMVAGATTSCGEVAQVAIDSADPTQLNINLSRVGAACNATEIVVAAHEITDTTGEVLAEAGVTVGLLRADVNGDRVVDQADVTAVRSNLGITSDANYRADLDTNGVVGRSDIAIVRSSRHTALP
ncbi:MAG: hypothetical protein ABIU29_00630 [Chthoniobacterales bacterium]